MASDAQLAHQRKNRKIPDEGEGSHAREIELKRSRGEISCAECRRYDAFAIITMICYNIHGIDLK